MGKAEAVRLAVTGVADALLTVTLAPSCAGCARALDAPSKGPVCPWCWDDVERGIGQYDGALRNIIHAFKYEGRRTLARPLGAILRAKGADLLFDADCVVPVPLFVTRRLRRGFNQAADLAVQLRLPVVHALWRIRPTAPQTGLTAAARRRNVRHAFMLSPLLSRASRNQIEDGVVVLVDDVRTTGATLNACAEVLKQAGAKEVRALSIARAELSRRV